MSQLLSSSFGKLFYDCYVPSTVKVTPVLRARLALELVPGAVRITHHTAVQLWGGIAPPSADVHVGVSEAGARCRRTGVRAHVLGHGSGTSTHRGVRVSTPVQAFLELGSTGVDLVDLVIAGDSLVKATGADPVAFVEAARTFSGRRAPVVRKAAGLIRRGVDSPMETRLRLLIILAGLPEPSVNVILRGEDGSWKVRFDLAYEDLKLIIEYDGRQHVDDHGQWLRDIERREFLDAENWRLIIVTAEGIHSHPEHTLRRVRSALLERGAGNLPVRFRPEWSRHFVGGSSTLAPLPATS